MTVIVDNPVEAEARTAAPRDNGGDQMAPEYKALFYPLPDVHLNAPFGNRNPLVPGRRSVQWAGARNRAARTDSDITLPCCVEHVYPSVR